MILIKGLLFLVLSIVFISVVSGIASAAVQTIFIFLDLPSLVMVVVPLLFFLSVTKSGKHIRTYIRLSFKKNDGDLYNKSTLQAIIFASKNAIKFCVGIGILNFLYGINVMLVSLDAPEAIGPMIAISTITIIYSLGIGFFMFLPLQAWAQNKMAEIDEYN